MVLQREFEGYKIDAVEDGRRIRVCSNNTLFRNSAVQDPLGTALPTLFGQIAITNVASTLIVFLLKPLGQPRFVSDIIGGILLGPTFLNRYQFSLEHINPFASGNLLETFTNLGMVYYMFLIGLEMNLTPILCIRRRTICITVAGILIPFAIGIGSYFLVAPEAKEKSNMSVMRNGAIVWGITLTATNLPDITRILSDLKLLRTEIGKTALSSAFVSDLSNWLFLIVLVVVAHGQDMLPVFATITFILFCILAVRPALSWLLHQTMDGEEYTEYHVQFVLAGVVLCGFITDALGMYSFLGAFMFGFILPDGKLANMITDRLDKVTEWIMLPLYCLLSGLRTNIPEMLPKGKSFVDVAIFVCVSWLAKFLSTLLVSAYYKMEPQEAVSLGVLMNTKGIFSIIIINIARDLMLVQTEQFTMMVVALLVMAFTVTPVMKITYRPRRLLLLHKRRTIQSIGLDSPFRVLAAIHSMRDVRGITNLLRLSNATNHSPILVFALHLVELTERTSAALLIMHAAYKSSSDNVSRANAKAESDRITEAFHKYQNECDDIVSVEALTALSPYTTMHMDICSIAEDKRASIIIIPFPMQVKKDDEAEAISSIRDVNQNVMEDAPCSVGLLVDRGLRMSDHTECRLLMFFIGGPDDREALSYAWRMTQQPNVHLTVVQFLEGEEAMSLTQLDMPDDREEGDLEQFVNHEREKVKDKAYMDEFKYNTMNHPSVTFSEEVVNNGDETLTVIRRTAEQESYDMCIIGRRRRCMSPLVVGLSDLIEYRELGAIGDAILASNFSSTLSLLVVQQYTCTIIRYENGLHRLLSYANQMRGSSRAGSRRRKSIR